MENYYYHTFLFCILTLLFFTGKTEAQVGCTIIKGNCPPADLAPTCATTVVNGVLGAYVNWSQPTFSLTCPGGGEGYDFVMSYNLNESQSGNECWLYDGVQRTAQNGGRLNLWQSNGVKPNPNFTTPTFFLSTPPTNCSMSITNGSGRNFTVNVYLIFPDGTLSGLNASVPVSGSGEYLFTITPPSAGAYRMYFEFVGNGSNKDFVDVLKINAPLFGTACTGDINFSITSNHVPGEFFPVGTTTVTYTAVCNSCSPVITETCSFNVVVKGVTATATVTNATCDLNNGSTTITATSSNATPALQYNLDNSGWVSFSSPATITGLVPGTHTINVRDYFGDIPGYCQILNPLSITIQRDPDIIRPVINCPTGQSFTGCDASVLTGTGLPYSPTPKLITLDQFTSTGATATDNCAVVSWQYQDVASGTCPLTITRTFTVSDPSGNTASCNQIFTVSESQLPTLSMIAKEFCVRDLDISIINLPRTDITSRPDWYTVVRGSTELDLLDYQDNCTSRPELAIRWRIDFANGTSLTGTGQVSVYGTDIQLPGQEGSDLIHHLTYWVKDKCGNEAQSTATITIHPRPQINKNTI